MTREHTLHPGRLVVTLLLAGCGESARDPASESAMPSTSVVEPPDVEPRQQQARDPGPATSEPVVPEPPLLAVSSILGAGRSFLAVMSDGSVRGWGANPHALLGPADVGPRFATPVATDIGERDLITHNDWLMPIVCWRDSEAAIHCRGQQAHTVQQQLSGAGAGPVVGIGIFAVHPHWTCAVAADGLTCRGRPGLGYAERPLPTASPVEELLAIVLTLEHACALERDGGVSCWGDSGSGRLGDFWRSIGFNPQWTATAKPIAGIEDAVELAAARDLTCARHRGGRVSCWGDLFSKPMQLAGVEQAVRLIAEGRRVCILLADGRASCLASELTWGGAVQSEPETVKLLTPLIDRGDLRAVALGDAAACVLVESGEVLCWGDNREGQLGDGTLIDRANPAPVAHLRALELPSPPTAPAEPSSPIRQDWAKLPEGCSHQATPDLRLADRSTEGFEVRTAYAVAKPHALELHLLDYHGFPDAAHSSSSPRGRQRDLWVSIPLPRSADPASATPPGPGRYKFDDSTNRDLRIVFLSQDQWSSITGVGTKGAVQITHFDDDWVCGDVVAEHGDERLSTSFAARRAALLEHE